MPVRIIENRTLFFQFNAKADVDADRARGHVRVVVSIVFHMFDFHGYGD